MTLRLSSLNRGAPPKVKQYPEMGGSSIIRFLKKDKELDTTVRIMALKNYSKKSKGEMNLKIV